NIIRVGPKGVEGAGRVGRHIGVITEEGAAKMVAGIDRMCADGVRRVRCHVASKVVEPRVIDVRAQIRAVDATFRWRRTCEASLPRRNVVAPIGAKINMAICRDGRSWKYVLDWSCG